MAEKRTVTMKTIDTAPAPCPVRAEQKEMTEQEAIKSAQNGDATAFEYLYRRHSKRVYAVCLRMVKDQSVAEDLTQEAFMRVFRKIDTFRGDSAFSTWLHRIAVNAVLMYLRSRRSKPESAIIEELDSNQEGDEAVEIGYVDASLAGMADRLNLKRAIRQLPSGYKQIFLLHDVMGYDHHEIASQLQCTVGNSKSQLHKARVRLRKILRDEMDCKIGKQDSASEAAFQR
jgi:RNA polymerase sigma-70 factor, ECF subfamily